MDLEKLFERGRARTKEIANVKAKIQEIRSADGLWEIPAAVTQDLESLREELERLNEARYLKREEHAEQRRLEQLGVSQQLQDEVMDQEAGDILRRSEQYNLRSAPLALAVGPSDAQASAAASSAWASAAQSWAHASPWSTAAVMVVAAAGAYAVSAVANRDIQHSNNAREVALAANKTERERMRRS